MKRAISLHIFASDSAEGFSCARVRRAFTLVEMVVVIAIIILLVGLFAGVTTALWAKSEQRETQFTIKLLDQALQEWQTSADRQITYGPNDDPPPGLREIFDINEDAYQISSVALFVERQPFLLTNLLAIISKTPQVSKILAQISDDNLIPTNIPPAASGPLGSATPLVITGKLLQAKDPWGTPMRVVFPGRKWEDNLDTGTARDPDGSIVTEAESRYGRCVNRQSCFVSAGPDLLFGNLDLGPSTFVLPDDNAPNSADDNIYSYSLLREDAAP